MSMTPPPSARQLMVHALRSAVPMIGFGFMDNTIMIHAGHYVDCTLGVTFGLSTLAAAGIGQIFSGIGGVVFGDALDNAFRRMLVGNNGSGSSGVGSSSAGGGANSGTTSSSASNSTKIILNSLQKKTRASRLAGLTGGIFGVTLGCTLGLINLAFVDEHIATLPKLRALEEGQEFEFEVEVDNELHTPEYTTVIVRGPDMDGVLASITAAIASMGCSVVELHAGVRNRKGIDLLEDQESVVGSSSSSSAGGNTSSSSSSSLESNSSPSSNAITSLLDQWVGAQSSSSSSKSQSSSSQTSSSSSLPRVEDVFLIRRRSTHQPIENEDLDELARTVLAAAKDPLNSHSLKSQVDELTVENMALAERVEILESSLQDAQMRVVPSSASVVAVTDDGKEER